MKVTLNTHMGRTTVVADDAGGYSSVPVAPGQTPSAALLAAADAADALAGRYAYLATMVGRRAARLRTAAQCPVERIG